MLFIILTRPLRHYVASSKLFEEQYEVEHSQQVKLIVRIFRMVLSVQSLQSLPSSTTKAMLTTILGTFRSKEKMSSGESDLHTSRIESRFEHQRETAGDED